VRRIIGAHDGHATGRHRHVTGRHRHVTRRAATGPRRTHRTGAPTDTRRERLGARGTHGHGHATGPRGTQRRRRPGGNTLPRARDRRGTSTPQAPGGTHCHGHPCRTRDEHATGTPQIHVRRGARPVADKRPNCARCVAWSG